MGADIVKIILLHCVLINLLQGKIAGARIKQMMFQSIKENVFSRVNVFLVQDNVTQRMERKISRKLYRLHIVKRVCIRH